MKYLTYGFVFILIQVLQGCSAVEKKAPDATSNLETTTKEDENTDVSTANAVVSSTQKEAKEVIIDSGDLNIQDISDEFTFIDHFETKSGVVIDWISRTNSRNLRKGELVMLEYRLSLPDGKIIDGNNRMKMPYLPFVIGYNIQNKGWDEALLRLGIGDIAQIKIPAKLAYGKKGLGTLIPPNTENWLYVKVHGVVAPSRDLNGIKLWELRSGKQSKKKKTNKVKFHMIASTENRANIFNTYASNFPVTYTTGQRNYPEGLREVLNNAKIGQQLFLILDPNMAYGAEGYLDLVKSNEQVFYNLKILEVD